MLSEDIESENDEEEKLVEDPTSAPEKITRKYVPASPIQIDENRIRKSHTIAVWKKAIPNTEGGEISLSSSSQLLSRSWTNSNSNPAMSSSPNTSSKNYSSNSSSKKVPNNPILSQWIASTSPPPHVKLNEKSSTFDTGKSSRGNSNVDSTNSPSVARKRGTLLPVLEKHKTLRLANEYVDLGQFKEAVDLYNKKIREDPNNEVALNNKGLALDLLGDFQEAIQTFEQALEVNPENSPALHNKSIVLRKLGRVKEAIECYDKVLEIDPMDAEAMNNKGLILDQMGKFKKAIYYYEMALNINPNHSVALYNKGYALRMLGKFDEALECYDSALGIDPTFADCWSNRALTLFYLGRFRKAIESYDQALQINPNLMAAEHNKRIVLKRVTASIEGKLCLYCRKSFGLLKKSVLCKNCLIHFCKKGCKGVKQITIQLPEDLDPNLCEECNRGDVELKNAQQLKQ